MQCDEIDLSTRDTEASESSDEAQAPIPRPRQPRQLPDDVDARSNGIIR